MAWISGKRESMDIGSRIDNIEISKSQEMKNGWFNECSTPTSNEIMYLSQIVMIFIVMITSLYNLTNSVGDSSLWTALLTSCLGYILPNPKIKSVKSRNENY